MKAPSSSGAAPGAVTIVKRVLARYVSRHWTTALIACLAMLLAAAMNVALPWLVEPTVRYVFIGKKAYLLLPVAAAAFAILVLRAVSYYVQASFVETIGERVAMAAQRDMFNGLMRRDIASLDSVHSGQFVSSFLYDATLLRDAISRGITNCVMESLSLAGYAALMIYQDWQLAILSIFVLPLVAWVMERIGSSLRRATKRSLEETGEVSTALVEALDGRRIVKAYGLESHAMSRAEEKLAKRLRYLLKAVRLRAAAVPTTDVFSGIVVFITILFAGYQTIHGELDLPRLFSFLAAMLMAQQPVRNLSMYFPVMSAGVAAANRVFSIIDEGPTIVDRPAAMTLRVKPAPEGGKITFKDVAFTYQADASAPALNGIDLCAAPGQKIALVGPSGAGKSTVFGLLLRFYDVDRGRIEVDGRDIREVTLDSLRSNIALVTQEPILFDESVADNIAVGRRGASRAEIEAAARDAAASEFIAELAQGYDTRIGEGGLKLSGGQRQRIAIARAMLRDAPILLLDEATSSLDTESERQVQGALSRLMKNRTTIVIAHRLSTVQDADRIYVLDRGSVVEQGAHDELIALNGLYALLYRNRFDGHDSSTMAAISA